MRAGALVVILQSIGSLFSPYRKKLTGWIYALLGALLMWLLPRWEPLIILGLGFLSCLVIRMYPPFHLRLSSLSLLLSLYWVHFKAGALVFGTGLAIVPVLEREVVGVYHWLNRQEFLDAFAFGQVTPGPVTTVAAFVGYKAGGELGSLVSTLGMYSPGALMILFLLPWLRKKIEGKAWLIDFQLGAVPAVIGCLCTSAWVLMGDNLKTPIQKACIAVLLLLQIAKQLPSWMVIFTGVVLYFLVNVVFAPILS
jgi:chromate transport protein ChrA